MAASEMEARLKALERQVTTLENQVAILRDYEEIKKLQRIYGYYLEHWMNEEIVDLFADGPGVALEWPEGTYLGKEGVKRYFNGMKNDSPEFLHQVMQLCPVIDLDPDGQTARGRWYGFGAIAVPRGKGVKQSFMCGTYENEYVKENGQWKIKKFKWNLNYQAAPGTGWVSPERVAAVDPYSQSVVPPSDKPAIGYKTAYPSGYIFPFHYKHPITGKSSSEEARNRARK